MRRSYEEEVRMAAVVAMTTPCSTSSAAFLVCNVGGDCAGRGERKGRGDGGGRG